MVRTALRTRNLARGRGTAAGLLPGSRPASSDPPSPRTQRSRVTKERRDSGHARVVVIAVAQLAPSAPNCTRSGCAPSDRSNPASRTPRWRRPVTARTRTVTTCSSRRSGRDAWFAAAPRPSRVQWLLARGDPAVRQEQESRNSPDSVRFWRHLQIAEVFFRPSPGLLASAPRLHFEIRAAPDSDPGSLFLVGKHRRITGRIQTRAQIRRHPCLGNYWQPDHPFFRFVVE